MNNKHESNVQHNISEIGESDSLNDGDLPDGTCVGCKVTISRNINNWYTCTCVQIVLLKDTLLEQPW